MYSSFYTLLHTFIHKYITLSQMDVPADASSTITTCLSDSSVERNSEPQTSINSFIVQLQCTVHRYLRIVHLNFNG